MQSTSLPSQSQVESFSAPDFNLNRTVEEILAQDFGAVPADEKDLLGTIPYFDQTFDITLDVYEGLISVKDHTPSIPRDRIPLRTAHDIRQFSRNSRMRCFKWLKTLRQEFLFNRVFLSLTYHADMPDTIEAQHEDLEKFLRFLRNPIIDVHYIWKRETQKRGVVHYHLIIWSKIKHNPKWWIWFYKASTAAWLNIKTCKCPACQSHAVRAQQIDSYKAVSCYLNKYIAKEDDSIVEAGWGRYWGTSRDTPHDPIQSVHISTAERNKLRELVRDYVVRQGGTNSDFLDFLASAKSFTVFIEAPEAMELLKMSLNQTVT